MAKNAFEKSKQIKALPPYFGGKRKLAPLLAQMFRQAGYGPECGLPLIDGFTGGGGTALYYKLCGYEVHTNDLSFRSSLMGKALIQNSSRKFTQTDLLRLLAFKRPGEGVVLRDYTPTHFPRKHGEMIDQLVQFAHAQPDELLKAVTLLIAWKYLIALRPMTQFNSPNAFNRPFEEGRFDEIKHTYWGTLVTAAAPPRKLLERVIEDVNGGIFPNSKPNTAQQGDAVQFVRREGPHVVYLDPPYPNTLSYEANYKSIDEILTDTNIELEISDFSGKDAWNFIDLMLGQVREADHPCVMVSLGSAGGKNKRSELSDLLLKNFPPELYHHRFENIAFKHVSANATEEFQAKNEEWAYMAWKRDFPGSVKPEKPEKL